MGEQEGNHYMTYEMCQRLHAEYSKRIDDALEAGGRQMDKLEKNVECLHRKLTNIKTWVIVTLVAILLDIGRGALVYLKVLGK